MKVKIKHSGWSLMLLEDIFELFFSTQESYRVQILFTVLLCGTEVVICATYSLINC